MKNADLSLADDQSLWRYASIHPAKGLAVAQVAHCPNGLIFDPTKIAFTNTVTVLLMDDRFASVPFDLILLSNVYVWFYAIGARMGVLRTLRSHIYPANLALLPWNNQLSTGAASIESMRASLVETCTRRIAMAESLKSELDGLNLSTLKQRLRKDKSVNATWGESFDQDDDKVLIAQPSCQGEGEQWRVRIGQGLFDRIDLSDRSIAEGLVMALTQHDGEELDKTSIRNLMIPCSSGEVTAWNKVLSKFAESDLISAMDKAVEKLDAVVGKALGLSQADIEFIQNDISQDTFLSGD